MALVRSRCLEALVAVLEVVHAGLPSFVALMARVHASRRATTCVLSHVLSALLLRLGCSCATVGVHRGLLPLPGKVLRFKVLDIGLSVAEGVVAAHPLSMSKLVTQTGATTLTLSPDYS